MWNAIFIDQPRAGFTTTLLFNEAHLSEVSVKATGSERLSGDQLREVRVMELASRALQGKYQCPVSEETIQIIKQNPKRTPESIKAAGLLHEYATMIGMPASKFVQDTLGIPPATAGRWVAAYKAS